MTDELHRTIDAVWRIESARIVATVARIVRDVGEAEELAQDALVAALEHWPAEGLPDNPAAWLIPCHHVLRANGALGGYRWGIDRKRAMLAWEVAQSVVSAS